MLSWTSIHQQAHADGQGKLRVWPQRRGGQGSSQMCAASSACLQVLS